MWRILPAPQAYTAIVVREAGGVIHILPDHAFVLLFRQASSVISRHS